ncbi:MAG TPA: 3'-5' exonuclease [Candidatus Avacidaminococcus intestinavium]|uniref:3'-5' exonuclease n=1 Tax=Candidatus Avacidaminococcus intestinavium TaxID=2840684 RepID=A0A9D1MPJ5_9FIRM|nr:3'-5' exonuclease [Candidatus Avacidaminococcus intestinavium]
MNFVALDFETANNSKASVCSIGIVTVKNNKIADEYYSLVKPQDMLFDSNNIQVHGITPGMVAAAPDFPAIWPEILARLDGQLVIAHYAKFDINVLKAVLDAYNIDYPAIQYMCSWLISKAAWPDLPTYRLDFLANKIGFEFKHHNALEDARACAELMLAIGYENSNPSMEELSDRYSCEIESIIPQVSLF